LSATVTVRRGVDNRVTVPHNTTGTKLLPARYTINVELGMSRT
jgi:hypothetical protein